jgi:hypothetical protein
VRFRFCVECAGAPLRVFGGRRIVLGLRNCWVRTADRAARYASGRCPSELAGSVDRRRNQIAVALLHHLEDRGMVCCPYGFVEDFDFDISAVAGRVYYRGDRAEVDHTVAHHAAGHQRICLHWYQPVTDLKAADPALGAGGGDARGQFGVPPHVKGVDDHSDRLRGVRCREGANA